MTDESPGPKPAHRRRPRYPGRNPRRFEDKYKELAPDRYPEVVAHVRAQGKTPAGQHVPILVDDVIAALAPQPGERAVDLTLGWGGHAEALLARLAPGGYLLGLDTDPVSLPRTEARLRALGFDESVFRAARTNFAGLGAAIEAAGWDDGADIVLADLGVSSMQLDDPSRGFSFKVDGPLDMRMNPKRGLSAADWLARVSAEDLAGVFSANADEPQAAVIADALAARRGTLTTTLALSRAVREAAGARGSTANVDATVRRVFQAVRIEVNDEFGALDALLRQLPGSLRPGGRAAILTFHSGEDRRVKKAFAEGVRAGDYSAASPDVTRASPEERRANPRAASAKLRWVRR